MDTQPQPTTPHPREVGNPQDPAGRSRPDGEPGWINRLVELHVLAEHGDPAAATEAQRWLATDADARRVWHEVERMRDELRGVDEAGHPDRA